MTDVPAEFQVVVLAGGLGSRLHPLADAAHPKPLLNVANKPLLQYALDSLHRAGFNDIIVLAQTSQRQAITQFVKETYKNIDLAFVDKDSDSADALRVIHDKIKVGDVPFATFLKQLKNGADRLSRRQRRSHHRLAAAPHDRSPSIPRRNRHDPPV